MSRLWILGAPDPEMEAIERLLRECGETVVYAADARGERVTAATAYRSQRPEVHDGMVDLVYAVECGGDWFGAPNTLAASATPEDGMLVGCVRIDHHRPGDPGYGRPPSEFLAASSIGQVIRELARLRRLRFRPLTKVPGAYPGGSFILRDWEGFGAAWLISDGAAWRVVPPHLVLTGAADHCLGAAYRYPRACSSKSRA